MSVGFDLEAALETWEMEDIFRRDEEKLHELHQREREALLRIANGIGGLTEAVLLAGSLGHGDLFRGKQ